MTMNPSGSSVATASVGVVHVHSTYSHDGRDSLVDIAEWARDERLQFVGITDHAEDVDEGAWRALVTDCERLSGSDLYMFPGLEFRFPGFAGVHLLACGLRGYMTPASPEEFIRDAASLCSLTIGAHPLIWRTPCPPAVLASLDSIEVWNAGYNSRYLPDPHAIDMVRMLRAKGAETTAIVGPDQHDRRKDPGLRIHVRVPAAEALGAIRAGDFVGKGLTMDVPADADLGRMRRATLGASRRVFDAAKTARNWWLTDARR